MAPPQQQASASANPIFVGPVVQAPLPSKRRFAPGMTAVVPRSAPGPGASSWSPPVTMGSGPCTGVICPPGLRCVNGQCLDVSCLGVICPPGQTCQNGQCVTPGVALAPVAQAAASGRAAFVAAPPPRVDSSMRTPQKPSLVVPTGGGQATPQQQQATQQTAVTPTDNGGGSQTAPPTYTLAPDQGSVSTGLTAGGGTTTVQGPLGPQGNGTILAGAVLGFFVGGPIGGVVGGIAGAFLGGGQPQGT